METRSTPNIIFGVLHPQYMPLPLTPPPYPSSQSACLPPRLPGVRQGRKRQRRQVAVGRGRRSDRPRSATAGSRCKLAVSRRSNCCGAEIRQGGMGETDNTCHIKFGMCYISHRLNKPRSSPKAQIEREHTASAARAVRTRPTTLTVSVGFSPPTLPVCPLISKRYLLPR